MILAIIRYLLYLSLILLAIIFLDIVIWNLSGISLIEYLLSELSSL